MLLERSSQVPETSHSQRSHQIGSDIVGSQVLLWDLKPGRRFVRAQQMDKDVSPVSILGSTLAMHSPIPTCWTEQTRALQTHVGFEA